MINFFISQYFKKFLNFFIFLNFRIMMSKLREYNKSFDAYWSSYDDQNVDNNDNATKLVSQFLIDL